MEREPSTTHVIIDVLAFVDWNSQLLLTKRAVDKAPQRAAISAFKETTRRIARCLATANGSARFRVALRLYHGWHKGFEPTIDRRAVRSAIANTDFSTLSQRPNVIFAQNVEFGDTLLRALDRRLHKRLGIHLPNTLRDRDATHRVEEKMVDTALASDVLATAFDGNADWILIVTEDDDLIPPAYVAEAILFGLPRRVLLLRRRKNAHMISLDDLLVEG